MKGYPVSAYLLFQIINCFCMINKILRRALFYLIFFVNVLFRIGMSDIFLRMYESTILLQSERERENEKIGEEN